ncbi:urease accessory protein [Rhodovulum sp. ES.010]|uniref:urease accessory protein UreD n=1 Tax=Rhodovulum sp. ES.010 TaxID=1882821 RepID=UPI0009277BE2|nr:urease accessory protein UreD [Rhodovulum sp. ES.010]SIO41633.1 urease accessory protein [Rhodovulum sp. ES.010]
MALTPAVQPRAVGHVAVAVKRAGPVTGLARLRQSGAFKALFPRVRGGALDAVLVNTAGGITGGDRFSVEIDAGTGAHLRVTTQAAERAYRAQPGERGRMRTVLRVAPDARIDWLPQETILYERSDFDRVLAADLAPGGRLLLVEPLVFGRAAMGEALRDVVFRDRIEIRRDGVPLYLDAMRLEGDAVAHLARPAVAGAAGAMASLVFVAPEAESHLAALRALMPPTGGASLVREDVLVLRVLAADSFALRRVLVPALHRLTEAALPRSWMT